MLVWWYTSARACWHVGTLVTSACWHADTLSRVGVLVRWNVGMFVVFVVFVCWWCDVVLVVLVVAAVLMAA